MRMTEDGAQDANRSIEATASHYAVEDTYWGYVIRSTERTPLSVVLVQWLSWLVGIAFLVTSLGLWLLPGSMTGSAVIGMKLAASMMTGAAAMTFLWFASRGARSELHVDTRLAEVREVVRNRAGRATLIARYGFDAVEAVSVASAPQTAEIDPVRSLVLKHRDMARGIEIARGSARGLALLKERLGQDMMLSAREARPSPYDAQGRLVSAA